MKNVIFSIYVDIDDKHLETLEGYRGDDSTSSGGNPCNGNVALNNASAPSATTASISELDDNNNDISSIITTLNSSTSAVKGFFRIEKKGNSADFATFGVTGSIADGGTFRTIPISIVGDGDEYSLGNGDDVIVSFVV